ncbi:MAG: hypothetical protein HY726_16570 [Candidatus Rokubacteria bacterium]|nr:hypothetical protein [Candidatus Rokubacteria bacterium]
MPRKGLQEIKEQIRAKRYELTGHAEEERQDDELEIADIERAILAGKVVRKVIVPIHDFRGAVA